MLNQIKVCLEQVLSSRLIVKNLSNYKNVRVEINYLQLKKTVLP